MGKFVREWEDEDGFIAWERNEGNQGIYAYKRSTGDWGIWLACGPDLMDQVTRDGDGHFTRERAVDIVERALEACGA